MPEEDKEEKKKSAKIIADLIGSATLIGATIAGGRQLLLKQKEKKNKKN